MPKVSIIVPVYNSERYLRDCVDSILLQSFRDFELILVDDGSTDGCGRIIDEYVSADSRVIAVHKENGGPGSARNAGLEAASSPYVYFPDSDDITDPALLETVIPRMDEGYDMVVFGFGIMPAPSEEVSRNMAYDVREETEIFLDSEEKRFEFIAGPFRRRAVRWEVWNRIFRRDIIKERNIRFGDDRRVFAEDMYFTCFYMAHVSGILLLPDRLYTYRRYESSGSTEYQKHLMFYSSNCMTEAFYEHCRNSGDCQYLYEHFSAIYYLLHKGAIRRLRRYQWKNGLGIDKAREILKENVISFPVFIRRMKAAYGLPEVRESYRKDRGGKRLQLTDRLYTAELLEIPRSALRKAAGKALLGILRRFSADRHSSAVDPVNVNKTEDQEENR